MKYKIFLKIILGYYVTCIMINAEPIPSPVNAKAVHVQQKITQKEVKKGWMQVFKSKTLQEHFNEQNKKIENVLKSLNQQYQDVCYLPQVPNLQNDEILQINIFIHGTKFSYSNITNGIIKKIVGESPSKNQGNKENYISNEILTTYVTKPQMIEQFNFQKETEDLLDSRSKSYYLYFNWSGALSGLERIKASIKLHSQLVLLKKQLKERNIPHKIRIIAHSHGGNVALILAGIEEVLRNQNKSSNPDNAQSCNNCDFQIEELILLGTPIQIETKGYLFSDFFKEITSFYSDRDGTQALDTISTKFKSNSHIENFENFDHNNLRQVKILSGLFASNTMILAKNKNKESYSRFNVSLFEHSKNFKTNLSGPNHYELFRRKALGSTENSIFYEHAFLEWVPLIISFLKTTNIENNCCIWCGYSYEDLNTKNPLVLALDDKNNFAKKTFSNINF